MGFKFYWQLKATIAEESLAYGFLLAIAVASKTKHIGRGGGEGTFQTSKTSQ